MVESGPKNFQRTTEQNIRGKECRGMGFLQADLSIKMMKQRKRYQGRNAGWIFFILDCACISCMQRAFCLRSSILRCRSLSIKTVKSINQNKLEARLFDDSLLNTGFSECIFSAPFFRTRPVRAFLTATGSIQSTKTHLLRP